MIYLRKRPPKNGGLADVHFWESLSQKQISNLKFEDDAHHKCDLSRTAIIHA
jgi:hypothetical protein